MHEFLDSNPGLRSRFSREITFPDYSTDDLVDIMRTFARDNEYLVGDGADEDVRSIVAGAARGERFGNARFVRTLFEQALNAQALRISHRLDAVDRLELMTLRPEDFDAAAVALGEERAREQT